MDEIPVPNIYITILSAQATIDLHTFPIMQPRRLQQVEWLKRCVYFVQSQYEAILNIHFQQVFMASLHIKYLIILQRKSMYPTGKTLRKQPGRNRREHHTQCGRGGALNAVKLSVILILRHRLKCMVLKNNII